MRTRKLFKIMIVLSMVVLFGLAFTGCEFVQDIFGKDGGNGDDTISVSGTVYIDPSVPSGSPVFVGFISYDPAQYLPNPLPWVNFSGNPQRLGDYYGEGGNYPFNFTGVPTGRYFMLALIDKNGNGMLDFDSYGDPTEYVGVYPFDTANDMPYLMDFTSSLSGIMIGIYSDGGGGGGFWETFDTDPPNNWVEDSDRWFVSGGEYVMGGWGWYSYASTYYNQDFADFDYGVSTYQSSGYDWQDRGIFFRSPDPSPGGYGETAYPIYRGYAVLFEVSTRNWALVRYDNGTLTYLGSGTTSYIYTGLGSWNEVSVYCEGNRIKVYFNGNLVYTKDDSTYPSGKVGVLGWDCVEVYNEFHFDDAWLSAY